MVKVPIPAKRLLVRTINGLEKKLERRDTAFSDETMRKAILDLKNLWTDLDTQETFVFSSDSRFEVMTRFVNCIMQHQDEFFSRSDFAEFFQTIQVQKQLMTALKKAQKSNDLHAEASKVIQFIKQCPNGIWADKEDFDLDWRTFKLLKNKEALEKAKEKGISELSSDFKAIKVLYQVESFYFPIEQKGHIKEWRQVSEIKFHDGTDLRWVFKHWYGIHDTGHYYIYIP